MEMIQPHNYFTTQGWMVTELGLKGNELQAYAIIYGFSQDGVSEFVGSLQYVSEWLGCSRPTAIKTLAGLVEKGLIKKRVVNDGVTPNAYTATPIIPAVKSGSKETLPVVVKNLNGGSKETLPGVVKNFNGGSKETLPNNYRDTYIDNYIDTKSENAAEENDEYKNSYEEIRQLYNSLCHSFPKCTKLSDRRKKAIRARMASGYTVEDFETLFRKAEASAFLKGNNGRNWMADFDWLINGNNAAKVIDGNYDDRQPTAGTGKAIGPNGITIDPTKNDLDGYF